jgi:AcrR family transcriptional regulator
LTYIEIESRWGKFQIKWRQQHAETKNHQSENKTSNLARRVMPKQKRAIQTVDSLLEISAILLDEVGLDAFNTNLLAERSNKRIATVYRYFPNKLLIISELTLRWLDLCETKIPAYRELGDISLNWENVLDNMVDTYLELATNYQGFLAVRKALQGNTLLRHIELEAFSRVSSVLVESLQKRGVVADKEELFAFAMTFQAAGISAIDLAWSTQERGQVNNLVVEQVKKFTRSYFASYLE